MNIWTFSEDVGNYCNLATKPKKKKKEEIFSGLNLAGIIISISIFEPEYSIYHFHKEGTMATRWTNYTVSYSARMLQIKEIELHLSSADTSYPLKLTKVQICKVMISFQVIKCSNQDNWSWPHIRIAARLIYSLITAIPSNANSPKFSSMPNNNNKYMIAKRVKEIAFASWNYVTML